jgi:hypothetical protein
MALIKRRLNFTQDWLKKTFREESTSATRRVPRLAVDSVVTITAKSNKVLGAVVSEQTPRTGMMHLEIVLAPAVLASPSIPPKYFAA